MATLNTYKVWRPSDGIFWEVEATSPVEAIIEICGEIVGIEFEVIDPQTKEIVTTAKTFHYGINGDEKFEYTNAVIVSDQ